MSLAITDWWNQLEALPQIFWGIAIVASGLFIVQFVLSLFGLDFDNEADLDGGSGIESGLDPSFTLLTARSIIAFFTFFGWFGLLAINRGFSRTIVFVIAFGAGLAALVLVAYLMYFFYKLSESGTANLEELIYKDGTVYLTIPGRRKGKGKIHVILKKAMKELDAVTEGEELQNGKKVKIIEVLADNTLVVEPVEVFENQ